MDLQCYRCGRGLAELTLPLARLDACPDCTVDLHVCRMCRHYLPAAPDACTEEDADAVLEKTRANFCEFFLPNPQAFDGELLDGERRARDQLATLFGNSAAQAKSYLAPGTSIATEPVDADQERANALFKK
jgi:hypothetical protein